MRFENEVEEAEYRLSLKGKLMAAGIAYEKSAPTEELEKLAEEAGA
jgi:hypothetical protein